MNFKSVLSKIEGILLVVTNLVLVLIPAATNTMSAGTAAKYAVYLNGAAFVAEKVRSGLTNQNTQLLTGVKPDQVLSAPKEAAFDKGAETAAVIAIQALGKNDPPLGSSVKPDPPINPAT